jgi:hypothetical protein
MKYLLYCICQQDVDEPPQEPGISLVKGHGLAAVVSRRDEPIAAPDVSALLAYESVVERIHASQDVIPLRYGCLMENEEQVVRLLEDRREEYEALFIRLRGMTEMGIRLLWPAGAAPPPVLPKSPGAAYLASLRNRYNSQDILAPEETLLADRTVALLAPWSTEHRREVSSSTGRRLLSLYFLTPKGHAEEFRKKARELSLPRGVKLLLNGPWPPYNFVASAD